MHVSRELFFAVLRQRAFEHRHLDAESGCAGPATAHRLRRWIQVVQVHEGVVAQKRSVRGAFGPQQRGDELVSQPSQRLSSNEPRT